MATLDNILSDYLGSRYEYTVISPSNKLASSSYNIKHYIKIGSECPICYEEIFTNKTAFINKCGHYFHSKCIVECINRHYDNYYGKSPCPCPMCRANIETNDLFLYEKYKINRKKINYLDILDNFYDERVFKYNKYYCKKCKKFNVRKKCQDCKYYSYNSDDSDDWDFFDINGDDDYTDSDDSDSDDDSVISSDDDSVISNDSNDFIGIINRISLNYYHF